MPPAPTPSTLLADALRADPARPLLTFHDHASGERSELSVATFANWVAKTANLLRDELDAEPGQRVAVRLPVHWQAAVWLQAAWAAGLGVVLDEGAPADLAVVSHEDPAPLDPGPDSGSRVAVSLGLAPMGLPRPGREPVVAGALDYDREIHAHGDRFDAPPPAPGAVALVDRAGTTTGAELAAQAASAARPGGALLVTDPLTSRETVLGGLLVPLASGVTAVLCRHADPGLLAGTVEQERVAAAVGGPWRHVPAWRPGPAG